MIVDVCQKKNEKPYPIVFQITKKQKVTNILVNIRNI